MTSVLVCDDAPLARESLRRLAAGLPGVDRVTAAGSGEEVLARYPLERPDLVLVDTRMPGIGGLETSRRLLAAHPGAYVVMLTLGEDPDGVARAVGEGAHGYLVKDATREEVLVALALALDGCRGSGSMLRIRPAGPPPDLTERERQVLEGMSRGRSNHEIGQELFLSEDTVKTHARRLFRKLAATDRAHAVAAGFRWGLLH